MQHKKIMLTVKTRAANRFSFFDADTNWVDEVGFYFDYSKSLYSIHLQPLTLYENIMIDRQYGTICMVKLS